MKATEKIFVARWWSKSAVAYMEDITMNPAEFNCLLVSSNDAIDIQFWSIAQLLEIMDEHDPRND